MRGKDREQDAMVAAKVPELNFLSLLLLAQMGG